MDRLAVMRVLADPSRHSVYEELTGGAATVGDIAERLGLHPSTVRVHLEKLREAGLVEAAPDRHGSVGRPHLVWTARCSAPALGLEPAGMRMLAHLLADLAATDPDASVRAGAVGRRRATELAAASAESPSPAPGHRLGPVLDRLARLGFDPATDGGPHPASQVISFGRCPFRELAVVYPDLVCQLHKGMTEALVEAAGGSLETFSTLVDPDPCRAEVSILG